MKKHNLFLTILVLATISSYGQQHLVRSYTNVITTAAPFLTIAPDARAGALGDCGVATDPDVYSMYYNPAKYAFLENKYSVGLGYTPWVRSVLDHGNFVNLAAAFKLSDRSTIAATARYVGYGEFEIRDGNNMVIEVFSPREFATDISYSYRFGDYLSIGAAARFVHSKIYSVTEGARPGVSVAGDVSVYYKRPLSDALDLSLGASITDIGTKLNYWTFLNQRDFIPTTLRLGSSIKYSFNPKNSLSFCLDFSKLLVPTPPVYERDEQGNVLVNPDGSYVIKSGYDNNVSVLRGMLQSFYDAPGMAYNYSANEWENYGKFYEELCEINTGIGLEYNLANHYFFRGGYYHESKHKGNLQYLTLGAGIHFGVFGLDLSYLNVVGTSSLSNAIRADVYFTFK